MIDKAPKLNRIEMVRSDVSGKLFPASDCEMVIIKIVKGKTEDINEYNPFSNTKVNIEERPVLKREELATPVVEKPSIPNIDSPEFKAAMQRRNSAIPPAMRDLFSKPPEVS